MAGKKIAGKESCEEEFKRAMKEELSEQDLKDLHKFKCAVKSGLQCNGSGGCFYFLGFLGAAFYYITTAPTFWDAVIGFLKAIVWPAFLVYEVLAFIGMQ